MSGKFKPGPNHLRSQNVLYYLGFPPLLLPLLFLLLLPLHHLHLHRLHLSHVLDLQVDLCWGSYYARCSGRVPPDNHQQIIGLTVLTTMSAMKIWLNLIQFNSKAAQPLLLTGSYSSPLPPNSFPHPRFLMKGTIFNGNRLKMKTTGFLRQKYSIQRNLVLLKEEILSYLR